MKKKGYYQGTEDPDKKYKPDKLPVKRENLDVRHPHVWTWYTNHDYTDDGPDETGIGGGLYHGPMDKFKSVKDFLDQRRKKMKKREEEGKKKSNASDDRLQKILKLAKDVMENK